MAVSDKPGLKPCSWSLLLLFLILSLLITASLKIEPEMYLPIFRLSCFAPLFFTKETKDHKHKALFNGPMFSSLDSQCAATQNVANV
jgi:hypothetical protein